MAMHLTTPEVVEDMRDGYPHTLKRFLSIIPRTVIFSCQILGVPNQDAETKGYFAFNYDNETGDYEDIKPDMTIEFGITEGGNQLGIGRVRKAATATTIYIGETDAAKIGLADNVWVSVLYHYGPHVKFPRLVGAKNGTDFTNEWTEYHDYDLAFADITLNTPKANITGESGRQVRFADWVDDGEDYRLLTLLSDSVAVSASIDYIEWQIGDCTFETGDDDDVQVTIRVPVGFRYIDLVVVGTDGGTDRLHLPLWTHDPSYPPVAYFNSDAGFKVSGDSRSLGREMSFDFFGKNDSLDVSVIPKTTTVCYWEKPRFKGMEMPVFYIHSFLGWVTDEDTTIKKSHNSTYRMTVAGPQKWMAEFQGFATILNQVDVPSKLYEMDTITTDRCILYMIREYSTFGGLINVQLSGLANYMQAESIQKGKLWSQIETLCKAGKMIRPACDSSGTLWLRRYRSYQEESERDVMPTPAISLELHDWTDREGIVFGSQKTEILSIARATGSNYESSVSTVVNGVAAGFVGGDSGNEDQMVYQRLLPTDPQTQIRQLVGHHYKLLSNPNRLQPIKLLGNYDVIEPAWGEHITITSDIENIRGIAIDREYIVVSVSVTHSNEKGQMPKTITWTLEEVTFGTIGQPWFIASEDGLTGEGFFPYEFDDAFFDAGSDAYYSPPSGTVAPPVPPECTTPDVTSPLITLIPLNGMTLTRVTDNVDFSVWDMEQNNAVFDPSLDGGNGMYVYTSWFKEAYGRCIDVFAHPNMSGYEVTYCDGTTASGGGGGNGPDTRIAKFTRAVYPVDMPSPWAGEILVRCSEEP